MKMQFGYGLGLLGLLASGAGASYAWADSTTAKNAPLGTPKMTYTLVEGSENWGGDKKQRIVEAMDSAVAFYNSLGVFDKQVRASYNAGTPTADGNYNGNIRFGGSISRRVALHELGHVLGVGTHEKWQSMIVDGKWTGKYALAQLREFDGPDAVLHADRQHFWPYGLNFDSESSPEKDRRHVLMVAAFRRDLGIVSVKETTAPPTLAGNNFLSVSGDQWKLQWNDEFEGNTLDKSKWAIGLPWGGTDGTGRHHNEQYASYIMDDDIAVRDGDLHLTTQKRDVTDKKGRVFNYTEGLITTSKSFRTQYGYFEIRAKMPTEAGAGTWPAFWTLSDGWPPEYDIIEYWGSDNRIHQGTVTLNADGSQRWDSFHQQNASISGWHTFGLEWGPGYQHYNIDGKITNSIYGEHLASEQKHYLLLNSGVDARRPPRPGTTFPNDFIVQYVRVYARPDAPALLNGDFEGKEITPWGRWNEAAVVDYSARTGNRCLRVDSGGAGANTASSMQQKVFGLKPNTRYVLSAYAKTTGKAIARLGAKEMGGDEIKSRDGLTQSADYRPIMLTFTTGADATSATIYCWSEGDGSVFFDDIRLEKAAN